MTPKPCQCEIYQTCAKCAPSPASASEVTLEEILVDAEQRKAEIAKLISEVLHERDKVEVMAKRADRYLSRAEAAEAEVVKLRALCALPAASQVTALIEDFRREVRDKLSVVAHSQNSGRLQRDIVFDQCENFLVEQFESALASQIAASREEKP
jgi:hypothetical protein